MVQYKAAPVITGAIKGTSCDRLYQELGLETLTDRRWSLRLFFFHKFVQGFLPSYLQTYHNAVSEGTIRSATEVNSQQKYLGTHFYNIALRNGAQQQNKKYKSINKFKLTILNFVSLNRNSVF